MEASKKITNRSWRDAEHHGSSGFLVPPARAGGRAHRPWQKDRLDFRIVDPVAWNVILLLFGPPGCGKGTQAAFLAERFRIPAISTGEMFRAECAAETELGKLACQIMTTGGLVGDDIVNGIVASRTSREDCRSGFLLDGYPRTVPQACHLSELLRQRGLPGPIVIHLDVAEDSLVTRLTARRQCPQCRRIYNVQLQPPRNAGLCDDDETPLIAREDDREEVIRRRLRAYQEVTGPVLQWYGPMAVRKVDGAMAPDAVARAVERAVLETNAATAR
jgi:adenylate kinase